jgi:hypothetical protein
MGLQIVVLTRFLDANRYPLRSKTLWASCLRGVSALPILNKSSIGAAGYGEPFVKRHGLFCMRVASLSGVWMLRRPEQA